MPATKPPNPSAANHPTASSLLAKEVGLVLGLVVLPAVAEPVVLALEVLEPVEVEVLEDMLDVELEEADVELPEVEL